MEALIVNFTSASDPSKTYTAMIDADGALKCNCRGWTMKRGTAARHCTHTKRIVADRGLTVVERDGFVVVSAASVAAPAIAVAAPAVVPAAAPTVTVTLPMLASPLPKTDTFESYIGRPGWVMEEKFDGHRCVVEIQDGTVQAWSRPAAGKAPLRRTLPPAIVAILSNFPNCTLDGEERVPGGKSFNVVEAHLPKQYVVFDVTVLLGQRVTGERYETRRAYLAEIFNTLETGDAVVLSQTFPIERATLDAIWARGGEGAVLKRTAAIYRPGMRSADWVKIKKLGTAETTITGYTAGLCGPYSVTNVVDADGNETRVKTLNNSMLAAIAANPQGFIGRTLVIEYTERIGNSYREPHWDHLAD